MKPTLVFLLLAMVMQAKATLVEYREGSWQVPNEMQELSAEQIKEVWPEMVQMEQFRAFMQNSPDKRGFITAIGGVRIAPEPLHSFSALRDVEKIKKEIQESFGDKARVTGAEIDSANQKIIVSVTGQDEGLDYKMRMFVVPVNDNKILTTQVIVDQAHFDELSPTIEKIGSSLKAYPQFRLSDEPSEKIDILRIATRLFISTALPIIWAFSRRKKSRWPILWVSILSALVPAVSLFAILWAIFGQVD
jgi:hypothetical protein